MSVPEIAPQGIGYVLTWEPEHVKMRIDRIRKISSSGNTQARVQVYATDTGKDELLLSSDYIINIDIGKRGLKQALSPTIRNNKTINWSAMVDQMSLKVLKYEEIGFPIEKILGTDTVERVPHVVYPFIYDRNPTLWFGDGGSLKSFIALALCITLNTGHQFWPGVTATKKMNTLYLDWERDKRTFQTRVSQICRGHDLNPKDMFIFYRRCTNTFVNDYENIANLVADNNISLLIIDSMGGATGREDMNKQGTATDFMSALRKLNISSLLITHTQKDGDFKKAKTAIGSVYYKNLASHVWEIKLKQEIGETISEVMAINHKNNLGPLFKPAYFLAKFNDNLNTVNITMNKADTAIVEEIALPTYYRIRTLLGIKGGLTQQEIATAIDMRIDTVQKTMKRKENEFIKIDSKYWLKAKGMDESEAPMPANNLPINEPGEEDKFEFS